MVYNHDSFKILLVAGILGSTLSSCSNSGDFRGAIGGRDSKSDDNVEDHEDEQADEPVQVSGAFLTCAFMDSESSIISQAKKDPESSLEVACGLFKEQVDGTFTRIEDNNLMMQARILTNEGKLRKLAKPVERLAQGSQLQFILPVPVQHLSGTVHVDYYEPATGRYSSRRKSIPTITEFSARYLYEIENDDSVKRFTHKEFELGPVDPMDEIAPEQKVRWWEVVVPIVVAAFGPKAQEPASYDNGATVYVVKKPESGSQTSSQGSHQGSTQGTQVSGWNPAPSQGSQSGSGGNNSSKNPSSGSSGGSTGGSQGGTQGGSTGGSQSSSGSTSNGDSEPVISIPSSGPQSDAPTGNDSIEPIGGNIDGAVQITKANKKDDFKRVPGGKRPGGGFGNGENRKGEGGKGEGGKGEGGKGKWQKPGSNQQQSSPVPTTQQSSEPAAGGSGDE